MKVSMNKPFLKWAGGKFRIADKVIGTLPRGKRLVEPFVGSGAIFINAGFENNLVADANNDLIVLFNHLKNEGQEFIEFTKKYFISENNTQEVFYGLRELFNTTSDSRIKSALFIYLNRHCFNGLCRYNSKGGFNVPFGRYAKPYFPEEELISFYKAAQHTLFVHQDFRTTMSACSTGDVIYCDPPYAPLTATASFTDYTTAGFSEMDQRDLADFAESLRARNIPVSVSNHDTEFTRELYQGAAIQTFNVQRFIASASKNRIAAPELIASYG
jgi:DNA adenine methylase